MLIGEHCTSGLKGHGLSWFSFSPFYRLIRTVRFRFRFKFYPTRRELGRVLRHSQGPIGLYDWSKRLVEVYFWGSAEQLQAMRITTVLQL